MGAKKTEQYVIIGGGVAALEAARAIRKRDADGSIVMLAAERHPPYNRPALPRVIAEGAAINELLIEPETFYQSQRIELRCGALAEGVDPVGRTVTLATGEPLPYTRLLLATGSKPFNPIKSSHGSVPVKVLRSYEDAVALAEYAPGRRVVLVGGGILGLEAAVALHKRGAKLTIVEFAPRLLSLQADEEVSAMLAKRFAGMGVEIICGASVAEATGTGARLADGAELPCDLVVASMGVRGEVGLAVAVGLELSRGIVVNEHMRTSREDIWAAGDCAEFDGRVQAIAGAARAMGSAAGASMAGDESAPYHPFTPAATFNLPGFSLFSAGSVAAGCDETVQYRAGEGDGEKYRRLCFTGGRLCGVLFVGGGPMGPAMQALARGDAAPEAAALLLK